MRLLNWMVYRGRQAVGATGLVVLLGALVVAAPTDAPPPKGARSAGAAVPPAVAAPLTAPAPLAPTPTIEAGSGATPTAGTDRGTVDQPESATGAAAALPCSPRRARPARPAKAPPVTFRGVIDQRGEQVGRMLSLRARQGVDVSVSLPADSFIAQPHGDWLVYGAARGKGSEVRAIDLETGCDLRLAQVAGIARAAVMTADGSAVYVHQVDPRSRRDLGVSRVDLPSGETRQVMPPFNAGAAFGPVYATSLSWNFSGTKLAVQSCGAGECHTRLLDPSSGTITEHRQGHGALVVVTATELIAFAAGHVRPAQLIAISIADSGVRVLAEQAFSAEISGDGNAPLIRVELLDGWQEVAP